MRNGFCQVCGVNVSEKDMLMHAEVHVKEQAAMFARTNRNPPTEPIRFHESMRVTELL